LGISSFWFDRRFIGGIWLWNCLGGDEFFGGLLGGDGEEPVFTAGFIAELTGTV